MPYFRMLAIVVSLISTALARAQGAPTNLDFETGDLGSLPPGWFCPTAGHAGKLTDDNVKEGKKCVQIAPEKSDQKAPFGNLMQMIDGKAYRGKQISVSAQVRVQGTGGRAQLWVREDCTGQKMGFFDNMSDRPLTSGEWTRAEIVGDISKEAEMLNIGLMVLGGATAWLDDVKVEILGDSKLTPPEAARALSPRGLENLVAFTRLLGYVRYFHPSDAAAGTDWEVFAVHAVRQVEPAENAAALAAKLSEIFQPIAPTVRVYEAANPPKDEVGAAPTAEKGALAMTWWRHFGIGHNPETKMIYSSRRSRMDCIDGKAPEDAPNGGRPLRVELGGGVLCVLPLAVYADDVGTFPRTPPQPPAGRKPRFTGNDRYTRLADIALAWNVFQHFFPYFDVIKTDWYTVLPEALRRAAIDADERAFLATLKWLGVQLHDGHVHVGHLCEPSTHVPPIRVDWIENKVVVSQIDEKAGGALGGLGVGTVIEKIDGKPAIAVLDEVKSRVSGATPQWIEHRAIGSLLAGAFESEVKLEFTAADGKAGTLVLKRTVTPWELKEKLPERICEIRPGIWYVDLGRLEESDLPADRWEKIAAAKGVVFDMRGYPRGPAFSVLSHLIDKSITCAQWHVPNQVLPDRAEMKFNFSNWPVMPLLPRVKGKIAFLTGGGAISAAETLMGIGENYKLGEIVGGPTAGTNGNVNPFSLPGGYSMSWTGMRVLKHDGSQHHGVGIKPTIPIARTIKGVIEGRDEVLEKGIQVVSQ